MDKSTINANEVAEFFYAVRERDSLRCEMDEKKKLAQQARSLSDKLALYKDYRAVSDDYEIAYHNFLKKSWALEDALYL